MTQLGSRKAFVSHHTMPQTVPLEPWFPTRTSPLSIFWVGRNNSSRWFKYHLHCVSGIWGFQHHCGAFLWLQHDTNIIKVSCLYVLQVYTTQHGCSANTIRAKILKSPKHSATCTNRWDNSQWVRGSVRRILYLMTHWIVSDLSLAQCSKCVFCFFKPRNTLGLSVLLLFWLMKLVM